MRVLNREFVAEIRLLIALSALVLLVSGHENASAQQSQTQAATNVPASPQSTPPAAPGNASRQGSVIGSESTRPHLRFAPVFTLSDINNVRRSLQDYRGMPVVLFFYCGCDPCHECARAWEQVQRQTPNPQTPEHQTPSPPFSTLVIFTDGPAVARDFARETGMDLSRTVLLTDPQLQATQVYHAAPCPRIFVLDGAGIIRYTNDEPDAQTRKASAQTLVTRALEALHHLSAAPVTMPGATALPALPTGPAVHLTLMTDTGLEATAPGMARWDAGEVDTLHTAQLERTFILKNETAQPITIARVQGSCGCQTLSLTKNGQPARQPTLNPGEKAEVTVAIRLAGQHTGKLRKYVWAYGVGNPAPLSTLEVRFSVREMVRFSPSYLNFGRVIAGTAQTLPFTVEIDASTLSTAGGFPPLTSTNANVQIVQSGSDQRVQRDGRAWIARAYRATLAATTPQGYVSGRVQFALPPLSGNASSSLSGSRASTVPGQTDAALRSTSTVSLLGEVIGEIAVAPKTAYFGAISLAKEQTRQLLLSGTAVSALTDASISTSNPHVTAKLRPAGANNTVLPQETRLLEVTLSVNAPPGRLHAEITVLSAKGDHLMIPVIADITP